MVNPDLSMVLMADDDEEDCMLAAAALADSGANADFVCVQDGTELVNYLAENACSEKKSLPVLILLDLNMPRKDGVTGGPHSRRSRRFPLKVAQESGAGQEEHSFSDRRQ